MSTSEQLTITVTAELKALVTAAVEQGDYSSTSELVGDALRAWQEKRQREGGSVQELRRLWDEGIASGPAEPLDPEAIKRKGRQRLSSPTS